MSATADREGGADAAYSYRRVYCSLLPSDQQSRKSLNGRNRADDINFRGRIAQNDFIVRSYVLRNLSFSFIADCEDRSASPTCGEMTRDQCNENGEAVGKNSADIIEFQPYLEQRRRAAKSGEARGLWSASPFNLPFFLPFMWLTAPVVFVLFQPAWISRPRSTESGPIIA
jgi:hypothetical protein